MSQKLFSFVAAACFAGALSCAAAAQPAAAQPQEHWYASWGASPYYTGGAMAKMISTNVPRLSNQTIRERVTLSHGGKALRVRLSNELSKAPLHIGAASIGYRVAGSTVLRLIPLTFAGHAAAVIAPGAPLISDTVALPTHDGQQLQISLYFPDDTPIDSAHLVGLDPSYVSGPGDFTRTVDMPEAKPFQMFDNGEHRKFFARAFISEVDVAEPQPVHTVIAFGDSITDGFQSTQGENRRWPDDLARRISSAGLPLSVIDEGISGNQVLVDGAGPSALARYDRDVLAVPGGSTVIILEGINDIGFSGGLIPGLSRPDVIKPEELILGFRQLIERAHARGLKVIGATMTPFAGSPAFTPQKEAVRKAVNHWIRTSGAFDAIVDFDKVALDPAQPDRLLPKYDSGDHIHPNDAGYLAMARAIDLASL